MRLPRLFKTSILLPKWVDIQAPLADWFATPRGQEVLQAEREILEQVMPGLFGYHLMMTGAFDPSELCENSVISHRFFVSDRCLTGTKVGASTTHLPFQTNSIDAALLHHSLDFEPDPHRMLKEVARVLIPGGKVVIVGFNPFSLWGLIRLLSWRRDKLPWAARFLSAMRISDWLHLLDYSIDGVETCYFRFLGAGKAGMIERIGANHFHHLGAIYVLVATKQESCIMPVKVTQVLRQRSMVPASFASSKWSPQPNKKSSS